jgi:hypothetical protein
MTTARHGAIISKHAPVSGTTLSKRKTVVSIIDDGYQVWYENNGRFDHKRDLELRTVMHAYVDSFTVENDSYNEEEVNDG